MSIDVLTINRLREQSIPIANTVQGLNANYVAGERLDYPAGWCFWDCIFPPAPTGATVLCVGCMRVGTDTFLRCGASCSWTVPAGVTVAKFEVWGAGGGTLPGCCCSIQPFGATGAYGTICIPVTAGQVYTLCAGCALCCYACQSIAGGASGCSFVCLQSSTNLIVGASGGTSCRPWPSIGHRYFPHACLAQCTTFNTNAITPFAPTFVATCATGFGSSGICVCAMGESCITTSSCTGGIVPFGPSRCSLSGFIPSFYGCVQVAGAPRYASGVPSLTSEICISAGSLCGYIKHPPIVGFANTSQCCVSWSSTQSTFGGFLCSPLNGQTYLTAPGSGGNMVYTVAGCNSNCGDSGRGGMVRVSFC